MPLSVADVLELPVLAVGRPRVRVGGRALEAAVRWVHISELTEVAGLLRGGELVLSTGMGLRNGEFDAPGYLRSLREGGAVGLVVELGAAVPALPDPLVAAARSLRFPLVELARPVRFVAVTEAVHGRLLHEQYEQLQFSERVHREFAALSVAAASPQDVLDRASSLLERPVVLEDLGHRALTVAGTTSAGGTGAGGADAGDVLADWSARSRGVPSGAATARGGPQGWMATPVGPVGQRWGRLVVPDGVQDDARARLVLERAAETLTLVRLVARDERSVTDRATSALLRDLLGADRSNEQVLRLRARALGLPLPSVVVPVAVHHGSGSESGGEEGAVQRVGRALERCGLVGLAGALQPGTAGVLVSVSAEGAAERAVTALARALAASTAAGGRGVPPLTTATAAPSTTLAGAGEGLLEACHVAEVAAGVAGRDPFAVHRSTDLGARGLLWWLRADPRLDAYVEGQLGALLRDPLRDEPDLRLLRDHLAAGGSMTRLARATGASRQGLYVRLQRLAARLGRDLADPEVRTSLHLALLAHDQRARTGAPHHPTR